MKCHTTNYYNTFIAAADDCPVRRGEIPPFKGDKTSIANIQFDFIKENPYKFTSDDILVQVHMVRNELDLQQTESIEEQFFSKGQACLRSSPLTKRYGWGIHFDQNGRIALYGCETDKYENFVSNSDLTVLKALKSKK